MEQLSRCACHVKSIPKTSNTPDPVIKITVWRAKANCPPARTYVKVLSHHELTANINQHKTTLIDGLQQYCYTYARGELMEMLLTVEQAAQRLQLTPFTIREHLKSGKLRGIKRGRVWRVPESALMEEAKNAEPSQAHAKYARALKMVAEFEQEMKHKPKRVLGVNDAATEIRKMRAERTP